MHKGHVCGVSEFHGRYGVVGVRGADLDVLVGEVDTRCNGNGGEAKGLESS